MTDSKRFQEGLQKAKEAEHSALQPKRERLEMVGQLISKCEADAQALVSALAAVTQDGLMQHTIQDRIADLEKQHAA